MYKRQVLPSAWSEKVRCGCVSDFERKKEVEMFKLKRGYGELVKTLNSKRINKIKDLPSAVNVDDYFDDTTVGDKHLPGVIIDVVDEYDDIITYLRVTNNIKVDWTKITNIDKFYEIIIRKNPTDYYGIMNNTDLTGYYIKIRI